MTDAYGCTSCAPAHEINTWQQRVVNKLHASVPSCRRPSTQYDGNNSCFWDSVIRPNGIE